MRSPITIYVIHHPDCKTSESLSKTLFDWFRLGENGGHTASAGLPVFFRRFINAESKTGVSDYHPPIDFDHAKLNVIVLLVETHMVLDVRWRAAAINLAGQIRNSLTNTVLLPVALHGSFYRLKALYEFFNPIRLIGLDAQQQQSELRRAVTEAAGRALTDDGKQTHRSHEVFLSHAKQDGIVIAESIRDSIRRYGQLTAWYDANDLPHGEAWEAPMKKAAEEGARALIAIATDAYPTRRWCRREAALARAPRLVADDLPVWTVQPAICVVHQGESWVPGVPMLQGIPHIGWDDNERPKRLEQIVDRLVLEILLSSAHLEFAKALAKESDRDDTCYISWIPDTWTLAELRYKLASMDATDKVRRIIYPGHGLTPVELHELKPVIHSFHPYCQLLSFDEAWQDNW